MSQKQNLHFTTYSVLMGVLIYYFLFTYFLNDFPVTFFLNIRIQWQIQQNPCQCWSHSFTACFKEVHAYSNQIILIKRRIGFHFFQVYVNEILEQLCISSAVAILHHFFSLTLGFESVWKSRLCSDIMSSNIVFIVLVCLSLKVCPLRPGITYLAHGRAISTIAILKTSDKTLMYSSIWGSVG